MGASFLAMFDTQAAADIIAAARPAIAAAVLRDAAAEMEHRDWSAAAAVLHRLANQQEGT